MCSGTITRYSCGHEKRTYFYRCLDGENVYHQELLPHRLIGRTFRTARMCDDCERSRVAQEGREANDRHEHEVRAKALLEYFRGERPWPRPDEELSEIFALGYAAGERLHPWLNRGNEPLLVQSRDLLVSNFPDIGLALFQEMLDRQARVDQTGVILPADRSYRLDILFERGLMDTRTRRHAELRRQQQLVYDQLQERMASLGCVERSLGARAQILQSLPDVGQIESQQIAQLMVQTRELQMSIYRPRDPEDTGSWNSIMDTVSLSEAIFQANSERLQEISRLREQISVLQEAVDQRREEIIQRLRNRIHIMEGTGQMESQQELIVSQETQVEQQNGLYASDPDWLQNFDDWCNESSQHSAFESPMVNLRRDINGWFQHLRSCPSQARQDWISFAESHRDAILEGDRCHYQYFPIAEAENLPTMSFRHWCLENADPAQIRISSMNYTFGELLEGYAEYLTSCECWEDLYAFRSERMERVQIIRTCLAIIPGAPLSIDLTERRIDDTPRNREMVLDIGRLCRIGLGTTYSDIIQRDHEAIRLRELRDEAIAVREGTLPGFTIERIEEERNRHTSERRWGNDIDDDISSVDPLEIPSRRAARAGSGDIESFEREQQDGSDSEYATVSISGFPASIRSQIDSFHDELPLAARYDQDVFLKWVNAQTERRVTEQARREVADEDTDYVAEE